MRFVAQGLSAPVARPAGRLVTHTFSLEEIREAFETAANSDAVKVMVRMQITE